MAAAAGERSRDGRAALEMKPACERCETALAATAEAYLCGFECTFCSKCSRELDHVCPNCGGELLRRT